jgi:diguanylate cyclase (GGDEF)-like protein
MMVDIDHFKLVNDKYGHQVGDEALKWVAINLQQAARKQDVVCRFGGEEFMVICPDTDEQAGFQYAERLRQSVFSNPLHSHKTIQTLTVSIGRIPASMKPRQLGAIVHFQLTSYLMYWISHNIL